MGENPSPLGEDFSLTILKTWTIRKQKNKEH